MNTPNKYFANEPKQKRSQSRVEKILDTVESISTEAPSKKIDIKTIAKRSFISVGAVYHHFPSVNSIFASLLLRKIQFRIHYLGVLIDSLDPEVSLEEFFDILIDQAFYEWGQKPIAGKSEALKFFYQNAQKPEFLYSYTQSLYPHINSFIERNNTNTFREITDDEWPFLNRVALTTILSPFFEQSPIAGSETHRVIVKDIAVRICSK
jgi:AcrR family transcriptional regulator